MARELIDVLEAAYLLDGTDDAWMRRLLEQVRRFLGSGLSVVGFFVDHNTPRHVEPIRPVVLGLPAEHADRIAQGILDSGPLFRELQRTTPAVGTASSSLGGVSWGGILPMLHDPLATAGVRDVIGLRTQDPSGRGVVLGATLPQVTTLSRAELHTWHRVCAHVAAALRLRRRTCDATGTSLPEGSADTEAVLRPDGTVAHAEGDATTPAALSALSTAVRDFERARGRAGPVSSEEALSLWRALVTGRWSLVDSFDHDGRRYVVARSNPPSVSRPRGLSAREQEVVAYAVLGHSNKMISYELGLSISAVSAYLSHAMQKLGVSSRVQLIRHAHARQVVPSPGDH
jgi:DNA-binding CsgD family transcriptional regulator